MQTKDIAKIPKTYITAKRLPAGPLTSFGAISFAINGQKTLKAPADIPYRNFPMTKTGRLFQYKLREFPTNKNILQ